MGDDRTVLLIIYNISRSGADGVDILGSLSRYTTLSNVSTVAEDDDQLFSAKQTVSRIHDMLLASFKNTIKYQVDQE